MCTPEELNKQLAEFEGRVLERVHEELKKFRNEINDKNTTFLTDTQKSHMAVAQTISGFGSDLNKTTAKVESFLEKYGAKVDDIVIWRAVHENQAKVIEEKIDKLDSSITDNAKWATRLLVGTVLLAVLNLVMASKPF